MCAANAEALRERRACTKSHLTGRLPDGTVATIGLQPEGSPVANPAFDVTPARLVTARITERGVCPATAAALRNLFPDR